MNLNIKTSLAVDSNGHVTVTSTRPVSSLLWDVVSKINDLGALERNRPNGVDTQLEFWANPPYTVDTVYALIIPAAYVATVWKYSVSDFWKLSLGEHLTRIPSVVNLPKGVQVDSETARQVISTWLIIRAQIQADLAFNEVKQRRLNSDFTANRVSTAKEALRRLRFLDPRHTVVGARVIKKYIAEIETDILPRLEKDHQQLLALVELINTTKDCLSQRKDQHDLTLSQAELATPEVFATWQHFMSDCKTSLEAVELAIGEYQSQACAPLMARLAEINPGS